MMKKITIILSIVLVLAMSLFGCSNSDKTTANLPISHVSASFVLDVYNLEEVFGYVDYVFIGTVKENLGTDYSDPHAPFTNYSVSVTENLKGTLEDEVTIKKEGGIAYDGASIQIYEDDFLPEVSKEYVFCCYAQSKDGSLLVSAPNSNINISDESVRAFSDTKETVNEASKAQILNAIENQIIADRPRSVSVYDVE